MEETFNPQNQGIQQPQQAQAPQQGGEYPAPAMAFRPKRGRGILTAIIILIILGIIGAGSALAFRVWDPVWSPFRPSPDKVISGAITNLSSIKSYHSAMTMSADVKSIYSGKLSLLVTMDSDITDPKNLKTQEDLDISLAGDFFGTGSPSTYSAKIGLKAIGSDMYASLVDIDPATAALVSAQQGADANSLKGVWVKVSQADIQQLQQNNSGSAPAPSFNPADYQNQLRAIEKAIIDSKVYTVKQQLPDQEMAGQKVYHYLIALDNAKLADLIANFAQKLAESIGSNLPSGLQGVSSAADLAASKDQISGLLDKLGETDINLFIGKNDGMLYGFETEKNLDLGKISGGMIAGTADLVYKLDNSSFNQPADIRAPLNSQNLEDMPIFKEEMLKSKDAAIESDMASLRVLAEQSYEQNGNYLGLACQSPDIKPACDRIKAITGEDIVIHQSKHYYCAYTKILETANNQAQYQCVNVLGDETISNIDPGGAGYCGKKTFKCPSNISAILSL